MAKNKLCVVDVETTGLKPSEHTMIEIAIIPVTDTLEPLLEKKFHLRIKTEPGDVVDQRALDVNKLDPNEGVEKLEAYLQFKEWLKAQGIKKIKPIGQYYSFDQGFIGAWLQRVKGDYSAFFSRDVIDTKVAGALINMANGIKIFPKLGLGAMAEQLGIDKTNAHSAVGDCLITLNVLKRQLDMMKN